APEQMKPRGRPYFRMKESARAALPTPPSRLTFKTEARRRSPSRKMACTFTRRMKKSAKSTTIIFPGKKNDLRAHANGDL
ncbi:MAG: hypothetical protein AABY11_02845, partial [archaeon]